MGLNPAGIVTIPPIDPLGIARGSALGFLMGRTPLKRVKLLNTITNKFFTVQFNPRSYKESIDVNYTRQDVRGLAHQPLDYENTGNLIVNMDFYADDAMRSGVIPLLNVLQRPQIKIFRNFLTSLCYPPIGSRGPGLADASPPKVQLSWPKNLFITAVVRSLKFDMLDFDWKDSRVKRYVAKVVFEEARVQRWTMEDALEFGNEDRVASEGTTATALSKVFFQGGFS